MNRAVACTAILLFGATMTLSQTNSQEPDRTRRPGPQPVPHVALPAIQKAKLANGLAVWLVEKHKLPLVAMSLVIQSGADQDPAGKPGVATMTAELLDAGTGSRDVLQIAEELEFLGASMSFRANTDASVGNAVTLTKHLDRTLALFADILTNPVFPEKEFERIRTQRVTSLLQQRDRAAIVASNALMHVMYGTHHPYGNDASGTEASLKSMTRNDIVAFYKASYRPGNATLIVVGDIAMNDLLPRIEKSFAAWEQAQVALRIPPDVLPARRRMVYLIDKPGAPQSEIRIGYPALARSTPDYFPVSVMNRILGGQFSSRINLNLREKRGYTYGARSAFIFLKHPGPFMASGGFVSAKTDSSVEQLVAEIKRMHAEGITAEELAFAKKGMTGAFALNFETQAQVANTLQNLVLYGLPDDYYATYLQNIDGVTLEDVRRVAAAYLNPDAMAILVVGDAKLVKPGLEKLNLGPVVMLDTEGQAIP